MRKHWERWRSSVTCCPCFETLASLAPPASMSAHPGMRWWCFNRLDLILRRPRSGRLEGWAAIAICDSGYQGENAMAQAEAFETDFWKDANLRKVWDDIVPGAPRKTIPYTLTRDAIELYCKSVGEDHPLYFDEAYAKTTPLWRADRAALDPHPADVRLHAGRRLDAHARHGQCRTILELQHSGAAGRRHHAARRARSTSSSSASGCSWCTTMSSSTSTAR